MMKVSSADFPEERRQRVNPEWHRALELSRKNCKELTACFPLSLITGEECSLYLYGHIALDLAEELSDGITVCDSHTLETHEICHNFARWLNGERTPEPIDRNRAYETDIYNWPDEPCISISHTPNPFVKRQVMDSRARLDASLQQVYTRWRREKLPFKRVANKEARSAGPALLKTIKRLPANAAANPIYNSDSMRLHALAAVHKSIRDSESVLEDIDTYFNSNFFRQIPHVLIRSHLYASQACRIAGGMKNPKPSDKYDIERISHFLPYVDVIVLENHFTAVLREILPHLPEWARQVQIFSCRELPDYCNYLQQLLDSPPDPHRLVAQQLFGG